MTTSLSGGRQRAAGPARQVHRQPREARRAGRRPSWSRPTPFEVEPLNFATLAPPDREAVLAFAKQTGELQRAALGTLEALNDGLGQVADDQADHRADADACR